MHRVFPRAKGPSLYEFLMTRFYSQSRAKIDQLENKLSGDLIMPDVVTPKSFFEIEPISVKDAVYLIAKPRLFVGLLAACK